MSKGRFAKGWQGIKICTVCGKEYFAHSGSQILCESCFPRCKECGSIITDHNRTWKKFCSLSCAGKWNYRNSEQVREALNKGIYAPQRAISISLARTGKPRPELVGEKNHNWKGGTGTERHRLMGQVEYLNWRRAIFERDDYTCRICGKRGAELNAHHVIYYAIDKNRVLDLDNGITVCRDCHIQLHKKGKK